MSSIISLTELFDALRCGLASLVPVAERIGMPWREGESYDDWDAVASTLYEQIVVNSIRHAPEVDASIKLPKYDMAYRTYVGMAYFEVASRRSNTSLGPFLAFAATNSSFSRVKHAVTDDVGTVTGSELRTADFSECTIRLRLTAGERIDAITLS